MRATPLLIIGGIFDISTDWQRMPPILQRLQCYNHLARCDDQSTLFHIPGVRADFPCNTRFPNYN
jgi:hypothetical protein